MASRKLLLACGLGLLVSGCAHSLTNTVVQKDGSCARSVRFGWSPIMQGADQDKDPFKQLEDAFALPSGEPWHITRGHKDDETFLLAERTLAAGEMARGDVAVKESGKVLVTNEATVRQTSPGHWEYREVLRALDKTKASARREAWRDDKMLAAFEKAMPPRLANDKEAKDALTAIVQRFVGILIGPPEPMLTQIILQSDLAQHLVAGRLITQVNKVLADKYGNRLTPPERYEAARQITLYLADSVRASGKNYLSGDHDKPTKTDNKGDKKDKTPEMKPVMLTFAVKMPGRITATNGKLNPVTGEVFWGLYPLAAELGDVVLSATSTEGAKP